MMNLREFQVSVNTDTRGNLQAISNIIIPDDNP